MPDLVDRQRHEDTIGTILLALLKQQEDWILSHPRQDIPWDAFEQHTRDVLADDLAAISMKAAAQLVSTTDQRVRPSELEAEIRLQADAQAAKIAADATNKTRKEIEHVRKQETDRDSLAALLLVLFGSNRALTVGTTEVTRAVTNGEGVAVARFDPSTGNWSSPIWQTEKDSKVCSFCSPLHGRRREYWVKFAPQGPPLHPVCRCFLVYGS